MSYSTEVLADSPLVYIKCDDTSGSTAVDSSGNGHDGGYNNTFTLNQSALLPLGSTSSVLLGSGDADSIGVIHGSWMDTSAFSVEAWVKLPSSVTGDHNIASRDAGSPRGWQLYVENGNIVIYIEAAGNRFAGSTTIVTNTVYHVVLTYDGSSVVKVYLNGAVEISLTGKTVDNTSGGWDLYWGTSHAGTSFFNFPLHGYIDECAFYGTALSGTRVAEHYGEGTGAFTGTGSSPITVNATGTGVVGISGTASRSVTVNASVNGTVSQDASLAITPGTSAAGLAVPGPAASSFVGVSPGTSASGLVAVVATVSRAVTVGLNAIAVTGLHTTASDSTTAGTTATGFATAVRSSSLAVTAGTSASGTVARFGSASLAIAVVLDTRVRGGWGITM